MKTTDKDRSRIKYVVNDEFHPMASSIIKKDPEVFRTVNIQKLCCVSLITKDKSSTERAWTIQAVKMPMALHCPYDWYVTFRSADWVDWDEAKKMAMVVDVLMCFNDNQLVLTNLIPCL